MTQPTLEKLQDLLIGKDVEELKFVLEKMQNDVELYAKNPESHLAEAVKSGNLNSVRSLLKLDLRDNRIGFKELILKMFYVQQNLPTVFEPFEISKLHQDFILEPEQWSDEYFVTQNSYLTLNFAMERLVHLANVKYQLGGKIESQNPFFQPERDREKAFWVKVNTVVLSVWEKVKENPKTAIVVLALAVLCLIW